MVDHILQASVPGGPKLHLAVDDDLEGDLRMRQRQMGHHLMDGRRLGHLCFQKFLPCRRVIEQIPDDKRGPFRRPDLFRRLLHASLHTAAASQRLLSGLCNQFHHGHGRDAGQRFSPEPKRADA